MEWDIWFAGMLTVLFLGWYCHYVCVQDLSFHFDSATTNIHTWFHTLTETALNHLSKSS